MMAYDIATRDFPENRYSNERYADLVALEWRIRLHADDRQTWADVRREITRHISLHPWKAGLKIVQRWQITEWLEHFCTLWEMRRLLERERASA